MEIIMKIFVPASSSSDSSYLLYKVLTETTDHVITRIFHLDASAEDLTQHRLVCEWLRNNVRDFDFGFAEYEVSEADDLMSNKEHTIGTMAVRHKCDMIFAGYNTYNWSHSNWYFQTKEPIDHFYAEDNKYCRISHSAIKKSCVTPIDWPFMNRTSKPLGRWQIYENLPVELKTLISTGCDKCGKCFKCYCKKWYFEKKSEGFTAEQIDDLIMKGGKYGKYWTPESTPKDRHNAYNIYNEL
jgi:hypothetical protein